MKRIYLDYAASTPLDRRVKDAMDPFWNEIFANPGSKHEDARSARKHLEDARSRVANILGVKNREIIFTSGGTESNSLAIIGFLNNLEDQNKLENKHIITSPVEHPSVLTIFEKYKKKGLDVDFAPVTQAGIIDLDKFKKLLKTNTVLVSIVYANSEIGTVQPIKEISNLIKKNNSKTIIHTDASQAPVFLPVQVSGLGVDMMTLDAQKIYGPKGSGILYKNSGVDIAPILLGGSQERGLRPGTENTPFAVAMAKALEIVEKEREETIKRVLPLREYFIDSLLALDERIVLNGSREHRSVGNVNISVLGEDNEFLYIKLDKEGISCATRSACLSDKEEGSYVLRSLGFRGRKSGLRFSLGRHTTKKEIDLVLEAMKKVLS